MRTQFYSRRMKAKEIEYLIDSLDAFENPVLELEQYPTPAKLLASIMHTIDMSHRSFEGLTVADFGTGNGAFAIIAALLGAKVVAFEVDLAAMEIAARNIAELELEDDIDLVHVDIGGEEFVDFVREHQGAERPFDCIVMNPPFGTRVKGIDSKFVTHALRLTKESVYSLHKTSTRTHLLKVAKASEATMSVVMETKYPIKQLYCFHKQKSKNVEVDVLKFTLSDPII